MLLTHLSGVFSRAVLQEEDLTNPILERIMNQYQEIAAALRQALPQIFPQKNLSEEEIAYMVLHFANSLERSPKIMEVDIAGFLLAVWLRQVCWKCDYGATFLLSTRFIFSDCGFR